ESATRTTADDLGCRAEHAEERARGAANTARCAIAGALEIREAHASTFAAAWTERSAASRPTTASCPTAAFATESTAAGMNNHRATAEPLRSGYTGAFELGYPAFLNTKGNGVRQVTLINVLAFLEVGPILDIL